MKRGREGRDSLNVDASELNCFRNKDRTGMTRSKSRIRHTSH